jgi:hypothetical protein
MTDRIDPSSAGHDNYVRTVIRTIAAFEQHETGQPIPKDVLMIGTDWLYLAKVESYGILFTINPVNKLGIRGARSLPQILDDFYSQTSLLSLIPEGEDRMKEARELGEIIGEREFSFKVRREKQEISVYRIRDSIHTENETNPGIGFTSFQRR